jgi:hypothetical protein
MLDDATDKPNRTEANTAGSLIVLSDDELFSRLENS